MVDQSNFQLLFARGDPGVPVPCFITDTTWTMEGWDDFASIISQSKLHPWIQRHGWHNGGCDMTCNDVSLGLFGPWVYLQLQTERHEDLVIGSTCFVLALQ